MSLTPLSETQQEIQTLARRFAADELAPHAAQWDRDAHFPVSVAHRMGELGFLGMLLPEEYDGLALDTTSYLLALEEIAARGRPALVVGGTGLYFSALTRGLADIPQVDRDRSAALDEAALRAALKTLDPAAEARIMSGDLQRLIRAKRSLSHGN